MHYGRAGRVDGEIVWEQSFQSVIQMCKFLFLPLIKKKTAPDPNRRASSAYSDLCDGHTLLLLQVCAAVYFALLFMIVLPLLSPFSAAGATFYFSAGELWTCSCLLFLCCARFFGFFFPWCNFHPAAAESAFPLFPVTWPSHPPSHLIPLASTDALYYI